MSAEVITPPERMVRPDSAYCTPLVAECKGDEGKLFNLALVSLLAIHSMRDGWGDRDPTHPEMRYLMNRLFTAWLALGEALGLTDLEAGLAG
ncbi:MAG TPA: hypothetical protein VKT70_10010 [Stellaceae bacterium]|nr:hypothetical protein [Stellaceae bacterium]